MVDPSDTSRYTHHDQVDDRDRSTTMSSTMSISPSRKSVIPGDFIMIDPSLTSGEYDKAGKKKSEQDHWKNIDIPRNHLHVLDLSEKKTSLKRPSSRHVSIGKRPRVSTPDICDQAADNEIISQEQYTHTLPYNTSNVRLEEVEIEGIARSLAITARDTEPADPFTYFLDQCSSASGASQSNYPYTSDSIAQLLEPSLSGIVDHPVIETGFETETYLRFCNCCNRVIENSTGRYLGKIMYTQGSCEGSNGCYSGTFNSAISAPLFKASTAPLVNSDTDINISVDPPAPEMSSNSFMPPERLVLDTNIMNYDLLSDMSSVPTSATDSSLYTPISSSPSSLPFLLPASNESYQNMSPDALYFYSTLYEASDGSDLKSSSTSMLGMLQ